MEKPKLPKWIKDLERNADSDGGFLVPEENVEGLKKYGDAYLDFLIEQRGMQKEA